MLNQSRRDLPKKLATPHPDLKRNGKVPSAASAVAISNQSNTDLKALDEKVKSMMEKGLNMIPVGRQANGTPRQESMWICKVCGKEGRWHIIKDHIEVHHLEGIYIPCNLCDKTFSARNNLRIHKSKVHK